VRDDRVASEPRINSSWRRLTGAAVLAAALVVAASNVLTAQGTLVGLRLAERLGRDGSGVPIVVGWRSRSV